MRTPKRIWLIEDDRGYRETLKEALLHFYGRVEIEEFSTMDAGMAAIACIAGNPKARPSLVYSDVMMPLTLGGAADNEIELTDFGDESRYKQAGLTLRIRFRQEKTVETVPWIFLTVRSQEKLMALDETLSSDIYAGYISKDSLLADIKDETDSILKKMDVVSSETVDLDISADRPGEPEDETDKLMKNDVFREKLLRGIPVPPSDCVEGPGW